MVRESPGLLTSHLQEPRGVKGSARCGKARAGQSGARKGCRNRKASIREWGSITSVQTSKGTFHHLTPSRVGISTNSISGNLALRVGSLALSSEELALSSAARRSLTPAVGPPGTPEARPGPPPPSRGLNTGRSAPRGQRAEAPGALRSAPLAAPGGAELLVTLPSKQAPGSRHRAPPGPARAALLLTPQLSASLRNPIVTGTICLVKRLRQWKVPRFPGHCVGEAGPGPGDGGFPSPVPPLLCPLSHRAAEGGGQPSPALRPDDPRLPRPPPLHLPG